MSNTTDILVREHALVLRGIDVLERAATATDRALSASASRKLLAFFEEFLDTHHHRKEEEDLFPTMIEAGFPSRGGPITVMLGEHDLGREIVRELHAALAEAGCPSPRFTQAAARFAALLREHVAKENGVLFPMSERVLGPDVRRTIAERWAARDPEAEARWSEALAGIERELGLEREVRA